MDHVPSQRQHDAGIAGPGEAQVLSTSPLHCHDATPGSLWRAVQDSISVTKPGIVLGNLITACGGFFLAAHGEVDLALFVAAMLGTSLIVAAGCVLNNCIDRDIDARMERTRERVLPRGAMTVNGASLYALGLFVTGVALLFFGTNALALALALTGFAIYVGVYSLQLKRRSTWSTPVGSLSGAMPPVIGYCAASGQFDETALVLLVLFCLWQMPHFYAITLFRRTDFLAAKIPMLPADAVKKQILGYVVAFLPVSLMPTVIGATGVDYLIAAFAVWAVWLALVLLNYDADDIDGIVLWAKRLFVFSIVVVSVLSFMMAVDFAGV